MKWLKNALKKPAAFTVLCSNVPITPKVKPGSKDTWDGYDSERQQIFNLLPRKRFLES
jgi:phosphodiesterase/alkaline phosphatase D-like protein